ncbi:hypothetical protein BC937DRAFT_87628 [Endogone sp. FLAS-F59071]|nr:hypothetical protein BC937DRAFT_87628 [Endogone sp. FLAS-F59071]|eukprot:RUS19344.1 hypothetical protein BC937DRAFT_87628 [Endogone sp. FLAS-F59071]
MSLTTEFNIYDVLERYLNDFGLSTSQAGDKTKIIIEGADPLVDQPFRVGAMSTIPSVANAIAAAIIWRMRGGQEQTISADLRRARSIHALEPGWGFEPTLNGRGFSMPLMMGEPYWPFLVDIFTTKDGRKVLLSGIYVDLIHKWLTFLNIPPSPKSRIHETVAQWDSAGMPTFITSS